MPQPHPDPMRYIPTKEEQAAAYAAAPSCHSLSHRLAERRIEAEVDQLDRKLSDLMITEGLDS